VLAEDFAPPELGGLVDGAEGDVVYGSGAGAAMPGSGIDEQIDVVAERCSFGCKAQAWTCFSDLVKAHDVKDAGGRFCLVFEEGDAEEASDGVLGCDGGETRGFCGTGVGVAYEFKLHPVGIGEDQDLFFEALFASFDGDPEGEQAFFPVGHRGERNAEGGACYFANASGTAGGMGPWEEGEDGSGGACVVAKVEVIGAGIVEVDGALDESQAENLGVEVEIALCVGGDGGDVMEANDGCGHGVSSLLLL
jgi:hypothetical protein